MMDIVEDRSSIVSFAVLLIVRLRFKFFVDHSVTIFARGRAPQHQGIAQRFGMTVTLAARRSRPSADLQSPL
jgi:hypothetical protein